MAVLFKLSPEGKYNTVSNQSLQPVSATPIVVSRTLRLQKKGLSVLLDDVYFRSWILIDMVPVGTQAGHGRRRTYPLPRVCVRGHPVVEASIEHLVWVGPRLNG